MTSELVEMIGVALGSGALTGALSVGAIKTHILYLREKDKHHEERINALENDVKRIDKETDANFGGMTRAHERIDLQEARLNGLV